MRAAVLRAFGGPHGLVVGEVDPPVPAEGEALVAVRSVCVNRTDLHVMHRTNIGRNATVPHIGGVDPAGEVVAVGAGVGELRPGDRVVARPMIPCLDCRFCTSGRESMCERPVYVGVHRPGGFGELVALPARVLYPIPDEVSFETASGMAHSVPIALHLVSTVGEVGPGDDVLVLGAAGGVGVAAAQVARTLGARVIAAARSDDRLAPLSDIADASVTYDDPAALPMRVRELTDGRGVSVAIDNVGDPVLWPHVVAAVDKGGRILSAGSHAGATMPLDLPTFYRMQLRLLATAGFSDREFRDALRLVAEGEVRVVVHRAYELDTIHDAFEEMLARRNVGKLVVHVS
ncbi:MAG TPA: alcohol dehydrogenase catalytic domain-containing protein [Candidatus Limnocylindrales bacterium]|nr:alcohol dehydrogenase catalytic domain-containing protein [Candidatus Limnocylindrales bacterium]